MSAQHDSYGRAMTAAGDNMRHADELAAAGKHEQARWLAQQTMQAALMLSFHEALYQGVMRARGAERQPDQSRRVPQTALQAWEDAAGTCNTCPGELEPAECLQSDPDRSPPPPVPWRALGAGLAIVFAAVFGLHLTCVLWPSVVQVAAR